MADVVGYIPFEPEAANLFFQLVSSRYERASLVVTSNKPFGKARLLARMNMASAPGEPTISGMKPRRISRAENPPVRIRAGSAVAGCFLSELHPGGESEFGIDVGEVGLHGAR